MKWDFDELDRKLNKSSEILKEEEKSFKDLVINIANLDETKQSYDILYNVLSEEEKEYHRVNEVYKKYISQYSQAYIEMSEYYYGPELPYDVYCREFKKNGGTYLDTPQDVKDLYALFVFYMFFDMYTRTGHLSE